MQYFHLGIIGAQGHRILVNFAIENRPAQEVETLRGVEHLGCTVDIGNERLLGKSPTAAHLCPYHPETGFCIRVLKHTVDKGCHACSGTSTTAIYPVGAVAHGIDAHIIVHGKVEIPHGTHIERHLLAVFVHIGTPVGVGVSRELSHEEMAQETLHIQLGAVTCLLILEVGRP